MRKKKQRKITYPSIAIIKRSKAFEAKECVRTIDGSWSNHTPYGFCYLERHKGYLSYRQVKNHNCFGKECPFLKLNLAHQLNRKWVGKVTS